MKTTKRLISLFLVVLTLCSVIAIPTFAASTWPSFSADGYCEYVSPGKISVYRDSSLKTPGTCSPSKSYNAYVAKNDKVYILEVTESYTKLSYPTSNGRRIGYVKTSTLFGVTVPIETVTCRNKVTTYTGASTANRSGSTAVGDTVVKLGSTKSGFVLIMYTATSGSRAMKAAFVSKSDYASIKGDAEETGNTVNISTAGTITNPVTGSFVRIRYSVNNRYLDVPADGISNNGTQLQIWDYAPGNQNQIFQLTDTGKGWRITSLQSGKVIEVRDSRHDDCAQVAQWDKHDLACARWDIVKNGDGTVSFRNRESGKYLNISGGGNAGNGTKIIQYHDDKSYAMRFLIEPVTISGYTTTEGTISSSKIKQEKDLSIRSWHPLNGLTRTMLEQDEIPESDIKLPSGVEAFNTSVDLISFVLSWVCNSSEVTRIHVTEGNNGQVSIRYGTSIEQNRSGKTMSLAQMLTEVHQGEAAYVLWAASDADKCIRNWFGLSGNGKYSMEMSFGKVKYGDYGYALVIENGTIRQIPLIHPDSSYDIYYKENNQTYHVMDAADVLRNTMLPLADNEARTVMIQLVTNGYIK